MIGPNIVYHRLIKQISQAKLAAMIGVAQNTISRWESGRMVPDANNIIKLAKALDCTPNDLLLEKTPRI